jgi:UDP-N-acetyl-D-mannosaminuronate dehydrogenase
VNVGVIGRGYAGLPLVVGVAGAAADVIGVDLDARKIAAANATQL